MVTAFIGIGVPGSGKSTFLKSFGKKTGAVYICVDDIREELTGDANRQDVNPRAWELAYSRLDAALKAGSDVVFDATNAKKRDRVTLVSRCRDNGATVKGFWFVTPLDVCLERNGSRERNLDDEVLYRMSRWLHEHPPKLDEGFDRLTPIDMSK